MPTLDTMDKVASVGAFTLALGAAVVAWRKSPRVQRLAPRALFSRPRRRYLTWLIARNRDVDLRGLGTQGPYSLGMENVYVDVSLLPQPMHEPTGDPLAVPVDEPGQRRQVGSFLGEWPPQTLAIVGPPGSGKTTLLRHLALALAAEQPPARALRRRVPILLTIRDLAQIIADVPDLPLVRSVMNTLPRQMAGAEDWITGRLDDGDCLIMFDGLDEVADPAQRRLVSAWVERQIEAHHANGFIITSRPYGYQSNPLSSADVLRVRPFTEEQVKRFIHGWYTATEVRRTGRRDDVVLADARAQAGDLLQRLYDNLHLYELAVNPLLLTMIAHVHRYRGVLPGGRAELYREICQVFLGGRQAAKGLTSELSADQRESVLRHLAFELMKAQKRDVEAIPAARIVRAQLARVAPDMRAETFLLETEQQSGLLIQRENGVYAFAHLTFQEYLASARLRERGRDAFLAERTDDPWWREVTLLYCANADAGPIVEACLRRETVRSLLLALDCAEVARELDPSLREQLNRVLAEEARSADPVRAVVIGRVRLAGKLRRVHRPEPGVMLVDAAITNAEFDLFLRATDTKPDQWPAHWTHALAAVRADYPATGLTEAERLRFCSWASEVTDWSYREWDVGKRRSTVVVDNDHLAIAVSQDPAFVRMLGSGRVREAKVKALDEVMSAAGLVVAEVEDYTRWLSDKLPVATVSGLAAVFAAMSRDLRLLPISTDARSQLNAAEFWWSHWKRRSDRDPNDLLRVMSVLCRLAESESVQPWVAEMLDAVLVLYWRASGLVSQDNDFWVRRN